MSKSEKKSAATLEEISELIRQGKLSQVPSTLSFDLNKISKEQYWTLMELLRHRSYGGTLLKRQHEIQNVVELRNLVNAGKFSQAETKLKENSDPEISVEQVRIYVFSGRYLDAIELSLRCLEDPSLEMTTRGVLSQLSGHAFLEKGELATAKAYFDSALDIATSLGNTNGQIAARLFLAKQSALEERFSEALHHIESARFAIVKSESNLRWLLGYFRTAAQIEAVQPDGQIHRASALYLLGERISHLLGDSLYAVRCRLEASFISLKNLSEEEINQALTLAKQEPRFQETDLAQWIIAMETRSISEGDPLTLQKLLLAGMKPDGKKQSRHSFSSLVSGFKDASWAYDSASGILVDFLNESFLALTPDSPTEKIIKLLADTPDRKMPQEELFEKVWKLKWNSERHLNTLKVALTRFNQNEQAIKILRENDGVSLNLAGATF